MKAKNKLASKKYRGKVMKSLVIIEKIRGKLRESDPENRTVTSIIQFNFSTNNEKIIAFGKLLRCFDSLAYLYFYSVWFQETWNLWRFCGFLRSMCKFDRWGFLFDWYQENYCPGIGTKSKFSFVFCFFFSYKKLTWHWKHVKVVNLYFFPMFLYRIFLKSDALVMVIAFLQTYK